ncbi:MAG TPA: hypothetical protein PLQ99_05965 [Bacilli bacterium]|nr:hypothetical protein [Bacilli bacterium]
MEYNTSNYFFKTYRDLKLSLEAAKAKIKVWQKELDTLVYDNGPKDIKAIDPSEIKASYTRPPVTEIYQRIAELSTWIANEKIIVKTIEQELDKLAERAEEMASLFEDDLLLTVFNLRFIKGMKLSDIAAETGYSLVQIKRKSAEINKMIAQN